MTILLIYTIKVAVYIIALYLFYSLMLSRDKSYGRNRAFIILSLAAAIFLPAIDFHTGKPLNIQYFGKFLSEVFVIASSGKDQVANQGPVSWTPLEVVYSIYIVGVIAFILKFILDLLNLIVLIIRKKNNETRIIGFHGFNTAGFSAMGHIFINTNLSSDEADEIIRHEQNHLRKNHFLDIIFMEFIKAFQWFNPAIHLFNRSLRAIHEYQADDGCLNSGVPLVNYQSLLLSQVFKTRAFNLTNSFSNPSLIRKRMIMMSKKRTSALASIKLLFVIPLTVLVILAISAYREIPESIDKEILNPPSNSATSVSPPDNIVPPPPPPPVKEDKIIIEPEPDPFIVVEEMPQFPGGDLALLKFIGESTNYPEAAKTQNIQGRVIIRFCVDADGGISRASVLKGVDPGLDAEALRVVNTLPAFEPGKQGGKAVPVWYMVPITFTLK